VYSAVTPSSSSTSWYSYYCTATTHCCYCWLVPLLLLLLLLLLLIHADKTDSGFCVCCSGLMPAAVAAAPPASRASADSPHVRRAGIHGDLHALCLSCGTYSRPFPAARSDFSQLRPQRDSCVLQSMAARPHCPDAPSGFELGSFFTSSCLTLVFFCSC
jgi:hypothetical protein